MMLVAGELRHRDAGAVGVTTRGSRDRRRDHYGWDGVCMVE